MTDITPWANLGPSKRRLGQAAAVLAMALSLAAAPAASLTAVDAVAAAKVYTWSEANNAPMPKASDLTKEQKAKYMKIAVGEWEGNIVGNQKLSLLPTPVTPEDRLIAQTAGGWQTIKDELDRYDICNPYAGKRNFCSPNKAWRPYMYDAWAWGKAHPDADDWRPAAKPTKGTGLTNKWGFVYLITYRPKGFIGPIAPERTVWKFGETAQDDWAIRAGVSLAQCDLAAARVCDVELLAVTEMYPSKYIARWVEAAAAKKWNLDVAGGRQGRDSHGRLACPPGMVLVCR